MKPNTKSPVYINATTVASVLVAVLSLTQRSLAVDRSWSGSTSTSWNVAGNWGGGIPTTSDIALFDNSSANLSTSLGANQSVLGIRIANPSGAVSVSGNTLTLGASGIDMSSATQNLTISSAVTLIGSRAQTWSVPASGTLTVSGALTASAGAALNVSVASGGALKLTSGTANTLLGTYATYGSNDWAVKNAANTDLVGGASVSGFYSANTTGTDQTPGANVDMSVYNSSWTGGQVRFANNKTVTTLRFNGGTGGGATGVEQKSGTALTVSGILVTSNYGAKDVNFTTGGFRPASSSSLYLHQNNTAGNLVFHTGLSNQGTNTLIKTGPGRVIIGANDALTSTHTITEGTLQYGNNGTSGAIGSTTLSVINHGNLQFNRTDAVTVANPISGTGEFTQAGSGVLTLSGSNSYTGATVIKAGTLTYSTGLSNFGSGTVIRFEGGQFQWPTSNTTDISSRTLTFAGGAGFDTNGNNVTLSNSIGNGGAGGLTKNGLGMLELTAANSYSGTTTVNAGILAVNGSLANTATTVNNGGTLRGSGSIAGSVTISNGGTLAAGNSIESLQTGSLTLLAGAIFAYEINKNADAGVAGDLTAVSGGLNFDLSNAAILNLNELSLNLGSWDLGEKLTLLSYSGSWNGGLFNYNNNALANGSTFIFNGTEWMLKYNDLSAGTNYTSDLVGSNFVTMTVVPEPSGCLLGTVGLIALAYRRRR